MDPYKGFFANHSTRLSLVLLAIVAEKETPLLNINKESSSTVFSFSAVLISSVIVQLNKKTLLDSITYQLTDKKLQQIAINHLSQSYVKKGQPFSNENINFTSPFYLNVCL